MRSFKMILGSLVFGFLLFLTIPVSAQTCTPDPVQPGQEWNTGVNGPGQEWNTGVNGPGSEWNTGVNGPGNEWSGCPPTAQNPATQTPIEPNPFYNFLRLFF